MKESCVSLPNFAGNGVVWLNGAYREFYQHVGLRPGARASKKKRARTSSDFSLRSRGDNQETVPPRNSGRYRRKEPERRPASFPHREKPRVWALESHVTDNFTLRTMGGVHTCRLLRNVQQICCSAQTGQHSRLQCPVWALQLLSPLFPSISQNA